MPNRVIYFPYIRLPKSTWTVQAVLYWDRISSIVPLEFMYGPERLGQFMQDLVAAGLVDQINPISHLHELSSFATGFLGYINDLGPERLAARSVRFQRGQRTRVHIEKLDDLGHALADQSLARRVDRRWYAIERETAAEFMTYLATTLGQLPQLDAVPLTDRHTNLRRLCRSSQGRQGELDNLRDIVINDVMPVPQVVPEADEVRRFKDRYGHLLAHLRRRVEREVIDLASLRDSELQARRRELLLEECAETVVDLEAGMRRGGWHPRLGSLSAIVASMPGVPWAVGLASAAYQALTSGRSARFTSDLAYAAYVRREFADE